MKYFLTFVVISLYASFVDAQTYKNTNDQQNGKQNQIQNYKIENTRILL